MFISLTGKKEDAVTLLNSGHEKVEASSIVFEDTGNPGFSQSQQACEKIVLLPEKKRA